ncbi:hypothetical protein AUJ68_04235 [Candidatus Woesearchaeota archaeon CG1_02_57_44]|nr:MAG: hypothetical protein AUJ68_04235 [Candidatus Woesearchaeota archaeon CG1_02_57_44]PIN67989.1 MAG: hypothetical protein COV94_06305 [Candidatus Woesearchaeota archaeon CG11_big_fil_rev_8_21_14_0_20_57_5]
MADPLSLQQAILAIVVGTLAAIVYSLRLLFLIERRVANVEEHIERVANNLLKEELKIEKAVGRKVSKGKKKKR